MIENRMLVDSEWTYVEAPVREPEQEEYGYINIFNNIFVPDEEALDYAKEQEEQGDMEESEFIEWFYSGNWIRRNRGYA